MLLALWLVIDFKLQLKSDLFLPLSVFGLLSHQRYPINQQNTDDVLTQPWFIILLGAILAIMMLSLGAMVFVKRRHMMIKQSALNSIRGKWSDRITLFFWYLIWKLSTSYLLSGKCPCLWTIKNTVKFGLKLANFQLKDFYHPLFKDDKTLWFSSLE